jgi:hypothetical protein
MSMESGLGPQLETFRKARRELEVSILPLATSVDGRRFSFQASLYGLQLQVGGYVMLEGDGPPRLGQVITLELDRLDTELMLPSPAGGAEQTRTQVQLQYARGEGTILEGDPAPFHDVLVRVATGPEVQAWLQRGTTPSCGWASWRRPLMCPAGRMPAASTGTRSCAANPGRARPTRSG